MILSLGVFFCLFVSVSITLGMHELLAPCFFFMLATCCVGSSGDFLSRYLNYLFTMATF